MPTKGPTPSPTQLPTLVPSVNPTNAPAFFVETTVRLYQAGRLMSSDEIDLFKNTVKESASACVEGQVSNVESAEVTSQYMDGSTLVVDVNIGGTSRFGLQAVVEDEIIVCLQEDYKLKLTSISGEEASQNPSGAMSPTTIIGIATAGLCAAIIAFAAFFIVRRKKRRSINDFPSADRHINDMFDDSSIHHQDSQDSNVSFPSVLLQIDRGGRMPHGQHHVQNHQVHEQRGNQIRTPSIDHQDNQDINDRVVGRMSHEQHHVQKHQVYAQWANQARTSSIVEVGNSHDADAFSAYVPSTFSLSSASYGVPAGLNVSQNAIDEARRVPSEYLPNTGTPISMEGKSMQSETNCYPQISCWGNFEEMRDLEEVQLGEFKSTARMDDMGRSVETESTGGDLLNQYGRKEGRNDMGRSVETESTGGDALNQYDRQEGRNDMGTVRSVEDEPTRGAFLNHNDRREGRNDMGGSVETASTGGEFLDTYVMQNGINDEIGSARSESPTGGEFLNEFMQTNTGSHDKWENHSSWLR